MSNIKVGVISLGCVKNTVDTEMMMGILSDAGGFSFVDDLANCDVAIINTCGFINDAKKESIDTIFEIASYKETYDIKGVIVTGCLSKRYGKTLFDQIPEADVFLGTENYHDIAKAVVCAYRGERAMFFENESIDYDFEKRILTTKPHLAYVKIAEGCDNNCTYCAIPLIRGKYRSRTIENILEEVRYLCKSGVKEIVLIAQDTTRYGMDLYGKAEIVKLLNEVSKVEGVKWVRVLYSYPEDITDELLDEIYNNEKICNYIDMPVQHFSDNILKVMNRKNTYKHIDDLATKIRSKYPDMILRTTLMVGFPSESEQDYKLLCECVKKFEFDRLGVFAFSKEEDTPAYNLEETVSEETKQKRKEEVMSIQSDISYSKNSSKISKMYKVIIDEYDEDIFMYIGRSFEFAPDSDGCIYITSKEPLKIGEFYDVIITNAEHYDLMGEV